MTAPLLPTLSDSQQSLVPADERLLSYVQDNAARQQQGQWRSPRVVTVPDGAQWPTITWQSSEGNWLAGVDWASNNYLGLAQHPTLSTAMRRAIDQPTARVGAGASRHISGTSPEVVALEHALAQWKGTEAALVMNSGYQANVAILSALVGPGDAVVADKLNHASLVDGVRWSGATLKRYPHLDIAQAERFLSESRQASPNTRIWLVTDSVFSMDGDCADLPALATLAERYGALLMVDEAHATGVFGTTKGSGLAEAQGISSERIHLHMGTFSKALGSVGAYVAGSQCIIDTLWNTARGLMYTTALPLPVIAANHAAVRFVQTDAVLRTQLWQNVVQVMAVLNPVLARHGLPLLSAQSPILPVILGDRAVSVAEVLLANGVFAPVIRPPTVPSGQSRIRLTISALHTSAQIAQLANVLDAALLNA